jgi:hypothetical protein
MSRLPASFRQSDVTKALKGVRAAGHEPKAVNITPECITVEIGVVVEPEVENLTALAQWRRRRASQT